MAAAYEARVRVPWWMIVLAPLVMLVAIPAPLMGWFGVPAGTALTVASIVAVVEAAIAIGTRTAIVVADGTLRARSAIALGPLKIPLGRERHLPISAISGVRLLRGAALKQVRQRLTNETIRTHVYGDRIGFEPGSTPGYLPGRPWALHLVVTGSCGRPQERLLYTRDREGFLRAIGHPGPPPIVEVPPVPLPDGTGPPPDAMDAYHPRERRRTNRPGDGGG